MEVAPFGREFEVLAVNCACWERNVHQFKSFSHGGWYMYMNGGNTNLSQLSETYEIQNFCLIFGLSQFPP